MPTIEQPLPQARANAVLVQWRDAATGVAYELDVANAHQRGWDQIDSRLQLGWHAPNAGLDAPWPPIRDASAITPALDGRLEELARAVGSLDRAAPTWLESHARFIPRPGLGELGTGPNVLVVADRGAGVYAYLSGGSHARMPAGFDDVVRAARNVARVL